jgi:hypothetical protein
MKRLLLKHTFILLDMLMIIGIAEALSWILSVSWTDAAIGVLIAAYSTLVIENWEKEKKNE